MSKMKEIKRRKLSGYNTDAVALLTAAAAFRSREERPPLKADMASFLSSTSDLSHLTLKNTYNMLRHICHRFLHSSLDDADLSVLASRVWPSDRRSSEGGGEEDGEDEDSTDDVEAEGLEILKMEAERFGKENGLSLVQLKIGMKFVDRSRAEELESKFVRHHSVRLELEMKKLSLKMEVLDALGISSQGIN